MVEILLPAINRQDLLDESLSDDDLGGSGYTSCMAIRRINLSDPSGISITGRTHEDLRMEVAEIEGLWIGRGVLMLFPA